MLRCNDCGFERSMLNSLLGTPHGPHCVGSWLEVPDRVYSGGNTSAANPMRVAEEAMQNFLAREFNQINQINQANCQQQAAVDQGLGQLGPQSAVQARTFPAIPSAMLIHPDDVAKWELFNAGQGGLAGGADEMGNLRRENLALQAEMKRCHDDNEAIRRASNKMLELKEGYRVEAANLSMKLADLKGIHAILKDDRIALLTELDFCKREITRLDPRLARARWGK